MSRPVFLSLLATVAIASGIAGFAFGAGEAPVATSPGLVSAYGEHATTLLSVKKTEELLVKEICADAYLQAHRGLVAAKSALEGGDKAVAAAKLERAAAAAALIANEGDKAVAAVRNRLLKGGHHHHATAEIAKKYAPGFVVVTKEEQKKLLAAANAIGKLAAAVRDGTGNAAGIAEASEQLAAAYGEAVK